MDAGNFMVFYLDELLGVAGLDWFVDGSVFSSVSVDYIVLPGSTCYVPLSVVCSLSDVSVFFDEMFLIGLEF